MPPRKRQSAQEAAEERAARLAELRKRWLELEAQKEDVEGLQAEIKTEMRKLVAGDDNPDETISEEVGDGKVAVQPNRRFDEATARAYLSKMNKDILPLITVEKLDSAKAKNLLAPAAYRQCMKNAGTAKVVIS
jgi:hypothetical protein